MSHSLVLRWLVYQHGDKTHVDALTELQSRCERAETELRYIHDRGDHLVYRNEWEAFDAWQRTKDQA